MAGRIHSAPSRKSIAGRRFWYLSTGRELSTAGPISGRFGRSGGVGSSRRIGSRRATGTRSPAGQRGGLICRAAHRGGGVSVMLWPGIRVDLRRNESAES